MVCGVSRTCEKDSPHWGGVSRPARLAAMGTGETSGTNTSMAYAVSSIEL